MGKQGKRAVGKAGAAGGTADAAALGAAERSSSGFESRAAHLTTLRDMLRGAILKGSSLDAEQADMVAGAIAAMNDWAVDRALEGVRAELAKAKRRRRRRVDA